MTRPIRVLVGVAILSIALASPAAAARHHHHQRWPWGMTPALMAPVLRVHNCEEPTSWTVDGSIYQGGLGWQVALWPEVRAEMGPRFRGLPLRAYLATPRAQGRAMRFWVHHHNHDVWPDPPGQPCMGY